MPLTFTGSTTIQGLTTISPVTDPFFGAVVSLVHFDGDETDIISGTVWTNSGVEFLSDAAVFGPDGGRYSQVADVLLTDDIPALGTGDFTIECWVKGTNTTGIRYLTDFGHAAGTSPAIAASANTNTTIDYYAGATVRITGTTDVFDGDAHHIAVCRSGGTTRMFVDGVQEGSDYIDANDYVAGSNTTIGRYLSAANSSWGNDIDEWRVTTAARYPTDFRVPSSAFPNSGGGDPYFDSVVLLNHWDGTDGATSSPDVTGATWNFIGGAQLDDGTVKFGSTSLLIGGVAGRSAQAPNMSAIGSSDFTIEMWINVSSSGLDQVIVDCRPNSTNGNYPLLYIPPAGTLSYYVNGVRITGAVTVTDDTWHHLAISRASGTTRLFVDGVQDGSDYIDATNYLIGANGLILCNNGYFFPGSGPTPLNGHLDDFRVTDGVGRYTTTFTPPDQAFPDY